MINPLRALGITRPPYLLLTPACVAVGVAAADACCSPLNVTDISLVMLGALMAHVSVNAFNECFDFQSGLDLNTTRTPFSGGSGTLVADPDALGAAWFIAVSSFLLTAAVGVYFLIRQADSLPLFLALGLSGLLLVFFYTRVLTRMPLLCLFAAGVGFGPLMTGGTLIALCGEFDATVIWLSVPVFGVVNNLLMVAQIPDVDADRMAGRNTWAMGRSPQFIAATYLCLSGISVTALVAGVLSHVLPPASLLALPVLLLGVVVAMGISRYGNDIARLVPFMALNVAIAILSPALLATGYWLRTF